MTVKRKRVPVGELVAEGYILEANRRFFHPLGMSLGVTVYGEIDVLDNRDDPEGTIFDPEGVSDEFHAKILNVRRIEAERSPIRTRNFGWWIQPIRHGWPVDPRD